MAKNGFQFKHVVITGASSGIGKALAEAYAAPGVRLGLTGRNEQRLRAVVGACEEKGAAVDAVILDVIDREAMAAWLQEIDALEPVDLIIANAGISAGTGGSKSGEDPAQVRGLFDVNVTGVLNTIEPLLPAMLARGRGHVSLTSSLAGFRGFPGAPAYCASKAAVRIYGEALRGTLTGSGVDVSVICPGFVVTPMSDVNDYAMPFLMPAEKAARIIKKGIARNRGRIAFPFPTYFFAWAFGMLPDVFVQKLLAKFPAKKASI